MNMQKIDHGPECEARRAAMETRAALIYCFVKAAKDMGLDYLTLGHKAMFASGVHRAQTTFGAHHRADTLAEDYMKPETMEAFDGHLVTCNEHCMLEESTYCPLVAAWQKLTDDETFIEELCDIAMSGDRGVLSCFEDFEFTLLGTIFDEGGKCRVQVKKKGD